MAHAAYSQLGLARVNPWLIIKTNGYRASSCEAHPTRVNQGSVPYVWVT